METTRAIAVALMLLGIAGMVWGAVEFAQNRESVEIDDIRLVREDRKVPAPAAGGAALFAGGAVLYFVAGKKERAAIA